MSKLQNILLSAMLTNSLKYKIRTGWEETEICERKESVAEHIYGTLMFAQAIMDQYDLKLDRAKVYEILMNHEIEEILMPDYSIRAKITRKEKIAQGKKSVNQVTRMLRCQKEIENLLDEFNARETPEAKLCYLIDKIECDFQAKIYDLRGSMSYQRMYEDSLRYGTRKDSIRKASKTASDFWIEYDRPIFENEPIFEELLNEIKLLTNEDYQKVKKEIEGGIKC